MNKRVLIIEDEKPAADRLIKMLGNIDHELEIAGRCDSIEDAVQYLSNNKSPDLIFADIQLADGLSFKIFEQIEIEVPVIFTTAFDEYALRAFRLNSIDYLLKPINPDELEKAIVKFRKWGGLSADVSPDYKSLIELIKIGEKKYKQRFLVRKGNKLLQVPSESVAYFISDSSTTFLIDHNNEQFLVDFNLETLEDLLDPALFFRVNRKIICSVKSVVHFENYFNGRLLLGLKPSYPEEVFVSRQRVKDFRDWLDS